MADRWEKMSPRERADLIRAHRSLGSNAVRELFRLTQRGLRMIIMGEDWKPQYQAEKDAATPPERPE